jgi:hypothetical protein
VDLPKGVHHVVSRGREYFYYQAGRGTANQGPRITLPNDPHSPEFWLELRKAQGIAALPEIPTFGGVCDLYQSSPHFGGLNGETQRQYRRYLNIARKAWGALPAEGVRPKHVRALLDQLAAVPGTANCVLGLLRALSSWGLERGHFPQSVTEGVKPYKSNGGHKPWTPAQCAAAEKNFTGMVQRAYFLARYTGQRGSDVVRLAETFIDDGGFRLVQKKTGREVWCPIDEALAAEMATWERMPGAYLRQNQELAGTTFHGLRGTRVVELRQRGATTMQIQDQVGMSLRMIERYCRFADKKANGKAAVLSLAERRKNSGL